MAKLKLPKVARSNRKENPEAVMSIGDHLRELRDRLVIAGIGIIIGAIGGWILYGRVIEMITWPLEKANANGANVSFNFSTILSGFDLHMRVALWTGVLLSSPLWMYEFWAYVGPGMTKKEKIYTWAFGLAGLILFGSGCALGIWIMPHAVEILLGFQPHLLAVSGVIDSSVYLTFYLRLVLVFGVAFLLPEFLVALNRLGLMKGTTMLKGWRWAVVLIFTFMAFANPLPDPWSMIFMALPITALYFIACGMSIYHDKRMAKKRAKEEAELDAALAKQSAPSTVSEALPASEPTAQIEAPAQEASTQSDLPAGEEPAPVIEAAPDTADAAALPAATPSPEPVAESQPRTGQASQDDGDAASSRN